ncbi:MAG: 4-hydroxymandelate oxidase [Actinoplanes sp.]|nr:4-hydroxymandelate oxidase [Actinoplanes sp.]
MLCLADFETAARDLLDPAVWDYIAGGAGDERTMRANLTAFDRYTLRPRMLSGVTQPQPAVDVLGARWAAPIGVAPTAYHTMVHPDGEVATAAGAAAAGLPMVVSTFAGRALADIAAATTTPLWLQVYCFKDRDQTRELAVLAARNNFQAIVGSGTKFVISSSWVVTTIRRGRRGVGGGRSSLGRTSAF